MGTCSGKGELEGTCQWKSQIITAVTGEVLWHMLSQRLLILMFCMGITMTVKMKNLCFVLCIDSYLLKCCKGETYILFTDWNEVKWKLFSRVRLFATPWTIQPWSSPGQNTGVGSLSLLQGIFPIQGSNLGLPHCRWIPAEPQRKPLNHLVHQ